MRTSDDVVHSRYVEVELPDELWLECHRLEFDDDVAAQLELVEEQVDVEVTTLNFYVILLANEGKPGT